MKFVPCLLFFFLIEMQNAKKIPTPLRDKRVRSNRIDLRLRGVNPHYHKSVAILNEISNIGETNLGIGFPAQQRFNVQFDTETFGLWVFSILYDTCDPNYEMVVNRTRKLWNETKSITYKMISPRRVVSLTERDDEYVFGYYGEDIISFFNIHLYQTGFTQVLKATKLQANIDYDGVFGLQYNPKRSNNIIAKICEKIEGSYMFSVHYPRMRTMNTDFSDGVLTLCGDDKSKYDARSMTYVDSTDPGSWRVSIHSITIKDTSGTVSISSQVPAAIDTTWNYIEGPTNNVENIYVSLRNYSVPDPENKEFPCSIVRTLPTIIFSMDGIDYSLQGYDYCYEIQIGKAKGCRILIKKNQFNTHWILGEPFLRKYYAKFDMERHRIGFAENK